MRRRWFTGRSFLRDGERPGRVAPPGIRAKVEAGLAVGRASDARIGAAAKGSGELRGSQASEAEM
ncbi:hypothetical protein VP06_23225 [Methylobacterium aquaticum]|uniref:Uncharacterized protein n=1 Tax=Methylobacterium aquaticum TaxID=270351 RepID=A0A0J6S8I1_9HYPH|nr:hypothetical protein VP06_23225 [Methylobacterium aquaticum]